MSVTAPPRKRNLPRLARPATRPAAGSWRLSGGRSKRKTGRVRVQPYAVGACLGQHPGKPLD